MTKYFKEVIGKAFVRDTDGFSQWVCDKSIATERTEFVKKYSLQLEEYLGLFGETIDSGLASYLQKNDDYRAEHTQKEFKEAGISYFVSVEVQKDAFSSFEEERLKDALAEFVEIADYSNANQLPFKLHYQDDMVTIISFGSKHKYILPNSFVETVHFPDFSNKNISEIKAIASGVSLMTDNTPVLQGVSPQELESEKAKVLDEVKAQKEEIEKISKGDTEELKAMEKEIQKLRNELQEKRDAQLAQANKAKFELEAKLSEMNTKLFYLETDINSIMGYLGETVNFVQVKSGINAPVDKPVVLYQKMRYLDEELARWLSLSNVDGEESDKVLFEEVLKYRDDLVDVFVPTEKSISLIKMSKNGRGYKMGMEHSHGWYSNLLSSYEKLHGDLLGLLVRNGGNLYLTWLDENTITFPDDMFLANKITEAEAVEAKKIDWSRNNEVDKAIDFVKEEKKRVQGEFSSRYILFSILQGILDKGELMQLPEKVDVMGSLSGGSPYIVLSMADGWLSDNRFPDFSEVLRKYSYLGEEEIVKADDYEANPEHYEKKKSFKHQKGDDIYVLFGLSGWSPMTTGGFRGVYNADNRSNSSDGRDLTAFANIEAGLNKISLVRTETGENKFSKSRYAQRRFDNEVDESGNAVYRPYYQRDWVVFSSASRSQNKSYNFNEEPKKRVNFRLENDEFINLTFLNSIYVEYAITSKNLGSDFNDYPTYVPMLNDMLRIIKAREEKELELLRTLDADFDVKEWQLEMSDWKLEHNVHTLTEFQAKRFLKYIQNKGK